MVEKVSYPILRREMAGRGVEVSDLAKAAGRSPRTVQNWLNGSTEPRHRDCVAVKSKLFDDVPTDVLFSEEDVRTPVAG